MINKEKAKSISSKILEGFTSPLLGFFIGIYWTLTGHYAFKVEGDPEGIFLFTLGCTVMTVAVLDKITIRLERKIDDIKESLKDATIGIPRYKRDERYEREPLGSNESLSTKVKTK